MPRRLIHRHQSADGPVIWLKAGAGASVSLGMIGFAGELLALPLLLAPLGASAVLVFGVPASPLSQPANVIGGHLLSVLLSLALYAVLPHTPLMAGLAVGIVIAAMAATRLTHPPAGADALALFLGGGHPLIFAAAILMGSVLLVKTALLMHRLPPRRPYPLPVPPGD